MGSAIFSAKRRTEVAATRRLFVQRFPRCFRASGTAKLPLARTIYQDLRQALPEVRGRLLRDALHDYTTGRSYLRALVGRRFARRPRRLAGERRLRTRSSQCQAAVARPPHPVRPEGKEPCCAPCCMKRRPWPRSGSSSPLSASGPAF